MSLEKELNAIRREPANKVCPNCQKEDKMGFDAVCWAFKSFVCSTCKSSHQAFSHRCKSVRMSNWSQAEVNALKTENGGGNANCTGTWLGNLESRGGRRPRVGDEEKVFKQFIDAAYNQRAYYKEGGAPAAPAAQAALANGSMTAPSVPAVAPTDGFGAFGGAQAPSKVVSAPANLLGDDLFGAAPAPQAAASSAGGGLADMDFSAFASAPSNQTPAGGDLAGFGAASAANDFVLAFAKPPPAPAAPAPASSDFASAFAAPAPPLAAPQPTSFGGPAPSMGIPPPPASGSLGMSTPPRDGMSPALADGAAAKKDVIMAAFQAGGAQPAATAAMNAPMPLDPTMFGGPQARPPPMRVASMGQGMHGMPGMQAMPGMPGPGMQGPGMPGMGMPGMQPQGMPGMPGMGPIGIGRASSFPTAGHSGMMGGPLPMMNPGMGGPPPFAGAMNGSMNGGGFPAGGANRMGGF